MKILWLGPLRQSLLDFVKGNGDEVSQYEKRIKVGCEQLEGVEFIVSYGYQFILKDELLALFPKRVINMHISYLPWNKGKDPNMWSFLEDSPKGVTIHRIDPGIDTGQILVQERVEYDSGDSLRTSYERLSSRIEALFMKHWLDLRDGNIDSFKQTEVGTFHLAKEKASVDHLLHAGWDTPVRDLIGQRALTTERLSDD